MKSAPIALAAALIFAIVALLARANSTQSVHAFLLPGDGLDLRRIRLIEFAQNHDWPAELARAGISLPPGAQKQLLEPLLAGDDQGEQGAVTYMIGVEFSGTSAFFPPFPQLDRAVDWIDARLRVEALLIDAAAHGDPQQRRMCLWNAYGRGFDERVAAFLAEPQGNETDLQVLALSDTLRRHLVERAESESAPR